MSNDVSAEQIGTLIKRYKNSKDPKYRAILKDQLASLNVNVTTSRVIKENEQAAQAAAKKGNRDGFIKGASLALIVAALPLIFGKSLISWTDKAEARQEIAEPLPAEAILPPPFDVDLPERVAHLKSQLGQLEQDVALLQQQKEKLQAMCEKVNDRMWNLAMISQENWVRQTAGRRDMVYINKDWLPDRELTNIEKDGVDKMSEKQRKAAILPDDKNDKP